jgi:hypothetical protein
MNVDAPAFPRQWASRCEGCLGVAPVNEEHDPRQIRAWVVPPTCSHSPPYHSRMLLGSRPLASAAYDGGVASRGTQHGSRAWRRRVQVMAFIE